MKDVIKLKFFLTERESEYPLKYLTFLLQILMHLTS